MARSPLMGFLRRAIRDAARERRAALPPSRMPRVTRRELLAGAAAAGAASFLPLPALAAEARIAIVGAGLAGLSAAYELKKIGLVADLYEGNTRIGGRCYTARGVFADSQTAEHGGEFIDTGHTEIRKLADELGLTLTDVLAAGPPGLSPHFFLEGHYYNLAAASLEWQAIYDLVQQQATSIGDTYNYKTATDAAKQFDAMTIADWVKLYVPGGRTSALGLLVENAFAEENALDSDRQSALNLVPVVAMDPKDRFNLYRTESDQRFHVDGGNDQIPHRLAKRLGDRIETATALTAIERLNSGRFRLTFARDSGRFSADYDRVILALPFSVMRVGVDYSRAGFGKNKVASIETLPMGISVKFQLQFTRRRWTEIGCDGEIRVPAQAFQTTWEPSRPQQGTHGILNFFSGGRRAVLAGALDNATLAESVMRDAAPILPDLPTLWNGRMLKDAWAQNPWSLGSYSCYPPNYLTRLGGVEREPEGNCFFAGEHTADQNGFLNAGVATGQRAAQEVIKSLKAG